jgi:uncharacterized membrane protein YfcA
VSTFGLLCLVAAFFFTAAISVVTGGTSLLTVPVMLSFGFEPHAAVATNMLSLVFLSLGGTLPFLRGDRLPKDRLWLLIAMTLVGSLLGASLLLVVPSKIMPLVIAAAVATLVFAREGLVIWRVDLPLSLASFAGGLLRAVVAKRVGNLWLRRIFVAAVIVMALKTLLFDVAWAHL